MTRASCIMHPPKQVMAIVRQDYYELVGNDACAAALLNIFEYWANAALAADPTIERPWVGARPIREFELLLLGIATDKQIRKRLVLLEAQGFIQTKAPAKRGAAKEYQVLVPEIQQALLGQMNNQEAAHRSNDLCSVGQITDEAISRRSNDPPAFGQMTPVASVKQPPKLRSNDRALKKIKEFKEKDQRKLDCVFETNSFEPRSKLGTTIEQPVIRVGVVTYQQPPESIDFSELWESNPRLAKRQLRVIAPGHRRLELVAHGFGEWWVGPGLNDFDEHLIQACRHRKRRFQQPDSDADAKTFINNMIRNGDWANFALRCEEAKVLRERAVAPTAARFVAPGIASQSPFERSSAERRASALGLVRFKVSQNLVDQALAISQQFGFSNAEIGLSHSGMPSVKAA